MKEIMNKDDYKVTHVPLNVLEVRAYYDKMADSYGKNDNLNENKKHVSEISAFSDPDELNACNKRTNTKPKIGDQRNIVDFMNFYPVKANDENYSLDANDIVISPNATVCDSISKEQEIGEKCLRKEKRNNWFKKFKNRGKY